MGKWVQLFWGFFKVGILGYGGGPGSISLIQAISVNGYHWMDNTQFAEMLAIGNALPGPIATKLAAAIGWQVGGVMGALSALIGVVLPSLVLMLGLYQVLLAHKSNPYVIGLIRGVKPIVIVLLVLLILDLIPGTFPAHRYVIPLVIFILGLVAIKELKISPVLVIIGSMITGALFLR
ncbi:chromate transporter [Sulfobacillus thermosulfidooxidans DSM 9293]|uniref:Chromate transporter n=2 Tax=Sulfobacillus thermosulfidooxidans TaxID=28034 RepID=A0A1W1WF55_SULTA|nr:chromate transporter [Sulfobacillus thermosulfidooxidans]PSR28987.1 MAG: chromate transporter [Sulfobacillus thermosulfidooxidans]SMC04343.1 chromate transporter [Sulfobacillus thermosulfidooxidans DSM 9293]